jgi:hypothetical protein
MGRLMGEPENLFLQSNRRSQRSALAWRPIGTNSGPKTLSPQGYGIAHHINVDINVHIL